MPKSRQELVPQARAFYAQGLTLDQVADSLGIAVSTVRRWKAADRDWESLRSERRRKDPHALLALIEQQRDDLVAAGPDGNPGYSDALFKLQRVITSVRKEFKDISTALGVLEDLAEHARQAASDEDLAVVRKVIESYLDKLKRETT